MTKIRKSDYVPKLKTRQDVNKEALQTIKEERSSTPLGLYSPFPRLNNAVGKYFRFGKVYSISGLSGHGKSALLNILLESFQDKKYNKRFLDTRDLLIVHNSFEMLPSDEILRTVSASLSVSYNYLLSSELDPISGQYNKISDEVLERIEEGLDNSAKGKYHYYYEDSCNVYNIIENVAHALNHYISTKAIELGVLDESEVPLPKVCVAIDHTLLVENLKGDSVLDTMSKIGKAAIFLKKKGYMVIFVGQFNNEIEQSERKRNKELHYPIKSDIYAQGQLYNACDVVLTIHQPELLGIRYYSIYNFITTGIIHLQLLKNRFGNVGSIWLKNKFNIGKLEEIEEPERLEK